MLTGNEYALLSAARLGLDAALGERQPNWVAAAQNACLTVTFGPSTPLLASQKASCLALVALRVAVATLPTAYDRCARLGPNRATLCRAPLYKRLARDAATAYTSAVKAQQAIVARGFTGACVTELGSTPVQLDDAHKLVTSTRKLSAAWHLLVGIVEGPTPRRQLKADLIERHDAAAVGHALRLALRASPAADLSSCPHQLA